MIVIGDNLNWIQWLISQLALELSIKDLGFLHHFLGIEVHRSTQGIFLSQTHYALELLDCATMTSGKTNFDTHALKRLATSINNDPYPNPTHYRSLVGGL